eukprot:CAMPEP_0195294792 /NCGR_PEP_ID=MMETSP0707-20130614/15898_1 /TAXON_ID=33640 /ORGANISM="Asterionellopsis glacialis, Strain CCMP134" /LENGTH=65 /DNA_ID=CAMNT_0040355851 /DNA_START=76 /DNA_END=269 /DNA_ORIENTATION=-
MNSKDKYDIDENKDKDEGRRKTLFNQQQREVLNKNAMVKEKEKKHEKKHDATILAESIARRQEDS